MTGNYYPVPTMNNLDWVTPAWLNTYVGGNISAVWVYTAAGQIAVSVSPTELTALNMTQGGIMVGKGAAPPVCLPKGLARQTLQMKADASEPEYGYPYLPECTVTRATELPITPSEMQVTWDNDEEDPHNWHSTTVNAHQIIPNIPGRYRISMALQIAGAGGSGSGVWTLRVYTPAGIFPQKFLINHDAIPRNFMITTPRFTCNGINDAVALTLAHQESGNRNLLVGSRFTMERVG